MNHVDITTTECSHSETLVQIKRLLDDLSGNDSLRQANAQKQLDAMGLVATKAVGAILCAERAATRRKDSDPRRVAPCILGCCAFAALLGYLPHRLQEFSWLGPLAVLVGGCIWSAVFNRSYVRQKRAVEFVLSSQDKHAVPTLLDLFDILSSAYQKRAILDALVRLLPKLHETDAALFTDPQRAVLHKLLLAYGYDVDYRAVVLTSLSIIGNASSQPIIKRLAYSRFDSPIRSIACDCLDLSEPK